LHNPEAGDEEHSPDALRALIEEAGHTVACVSVDEPRWEDDLAKADLVAIAGGDGTVGAALSELAGIATRTAAVLPTGSANNIAEALGLEGRDPSELVTGWERAERRLYRLGQVTASGLTDIFVETVGGGLFAEAIRRAEQLETPDSDKVELGLRVLRDLVEDLAVEEWAIDLDGKDYGGEFLAVEAMVIGETGPKIPLAPLASPHDLLLDVVLITGDDRQRLASYLDERLGGGNPPDPSFTTVRCTTAMLKPARACATRVDDALRDVHASIGHEGHARVSLAPYPVVILTPG